MTNILQDPRCRAFSSSTIETLAVDLIGPVSDGFFRLISLVVDRRLPQRKTDGGSHMDIGAGKQLPAQSPPEYRL